MAALDGAFALSEIDAVAMFVGEDLHLDVARVSDGLLDINFVIAEGTLRLAACRVQARGQFRLIPDQPHSFASATGSGFQHDGVAQLHGEITG